MALHLRVRRTLAEHKARYLGIFVLIFLGSFAFIWFRGFGLGYERLVSQFAEQNGQEDISFTVRGAAPDIAYLAEKAAAVIEPYRSYDAALGEDLELRLLSACEELNIPAVLSGRDIEASGELLLFPHFAAANGYSLGDALQIEGQHFLVVGMVALPHYVYPLKYVNDILPPSGFGVGVVSAADMEAFPEAETTYALRFRDREEIPEQTTRFYRLLSDKGYALSEWMDASTNKRIRMPWATISGMKAMSIPIPMAMFLLSCLIVGLMVWRMVRADAVIIGTLYAQGYRHRELMRHYLTIPLLLAMLGGLSGVLLAVPTIAPTIELMALQYYVVPYENVSVAWLDLAVGILMPVISLGLACWLVVRWELRRTPTELMKGDEQKAKVHILERSLKLDRFSFAAKFQLREQVRSIPRLFFLLFGVIAASYLMLIGFTITHSMNTVFEGSLDAENPYAWEYSFKEMRQGEPLAGAVPFNAVRCYPEGREQVEFYLNGIPTNAEHVFAFVDKNGAAVSKDQVNITVLLAERLGLQVGDSLQLVNKLDGSRYELSIEGILQSYAGQFIYMPLADFNAMLGMSADSYSGVFSSDELAYRPEELAGIKDLKNMTNAMDELMLPLIMVVIGTTAIAALMGLIIIYLVTSLMIEESRASISLLKIFGYRGKEVKQLILGSSAPIVIVGFLASIPLMQASAHALYAYLGDMINLALPMILNPLYVFISFVFIYGVYTLTKQLSGRRLEQIPMSEALKAGTE